MFGFQLYFFFSSRRRHTRFDKGTGVDVCSSDLAQRLEEAGLGSYNKGSIYRNLRQMEDSGLVSSSWDTSKDGPARRIYDLTDTGSLFLKNWITMADMHRNFLKTMIEMNPLIPSMSSSSRSSRRSDAGSKKKDDEQSEES